MSVRYDCPECGYYSDVNRWCKDCGTKMAGKDNGCSKCEYNSLNHAVQPNGPELIDCFKYMVSFPDIKQMERWARKNCDEPDSGRKRSVDDT